jgi:hypothetical protein
MMLELRYIDSAETLVHFDIEVLKQGSVSCYANPEWLDEQNPDHDPFTRFGRRLRKELETVAGAEVMYSKYGLDVEVARSFDLVNVLFDIYRGVQFAAENSVAFATTLGDDAFTEPEFVLNPTREEFENNVAGVLYKLRQRKRSVN